MALSFTLPLSSYPEEPKLYISSATLNLKPYKLRSSLEQRELLENVTFEWHTNVSTPPNTPVAPIVEKLVQQQTNSHSSQQQQSIPERSKDLFLPAFTFAEEDNLPTKVDKFMACERYHSQYQQAMTKRITNL